MARQHGTKNIDWSKWDHLLGEITDKEIAVLIGCEKSAVVQRRNKLKIQPALKAFWTEEDERLFTLGKQRCVKCDTIKPLSEFYACSTNRYGYRRDCKSCLAKQGREYLQSAKKHWIDLAGGCCQNCGFDKWLSSLDFHHLYDKDVNPSRLIARKVNWPKAYEVLDDCCLLCSNCHRAYHGNELKMDFVKRDGLGWTIQE